MERDEIEHQEFPAARRGYDAAAVHRHLRRVADEFEALASRPRSASLADGASTQVRAILEAAESSAQQLRDDAGREAGEHVERVAEAARGLLARLARLQAELDQLVGGVRSTAESLAGSLVELRREAGALAQTSTQAIGPAVDDAPPAPRAIPAAPTRSEPPAAIDQIPTPAEAGARLVALNMALEGAPRRQTAGYLAEHFDVPDVESLLDAVYASAGR